MHTWRIQQASRPVFFFLIIVQHILNGYSMYARVSEKLFVMTGCVEAGWIGINRIKKAFIFRIRHTLKVYSLNFFETLN